MERSYWTIILIFSGPCYALLCYQCGNITQSCGTAENRSEELVECSEISRWKSVACGTLNVTYIDDQTVYITLKRCLMEMFAVICEQELYHLPVTIEGVKVRINNCTICYRDECNRANLVGSSLLTNLVVTVLLNKFI